MRVYNLIPENISEAIQEFKMQKFSTSDIFILRMDHRLKPFGVASHLRSLRMPQ